MATVTASASTANAQVLIVGTADGLVAGLAAQRKAPPSTKTEVRPSYIATHHARKVTAAAATDATFATGSEDCSIVVSQIGCLFGGNDSSSSAVAPRLRYRITGAHALPVTGLAYLPSDPSLLVSSSTDSTVVVHRIRFVGSSSSGGSVPAMGLAQSVDKLVRMPFPVRSICAVTPGDGTLVAAAGVDEASGAVNVAIVDFGVAQRDGNGSGRPLQPFVALSFGDVAAPIVGAAKGSVVRVSCVDMVVDAEEKEEETAEQKKTQRYLCVAVRSAPGAAVEAVRWPLDSLLKAAAIGRLEEEVAAEAVAVPDEAALIDGPRVPFVGTDEQAAGALAAITDPSARPDAYLASLYSNLCWSTWARPAACVEPVAPKQQVQAKGGKGNKAAAVVSESDEDDEAETGLVSAPGFGKRARRTKARAARAEAEAAEWARLALAIDGLEERPLSSSSTAVGTSSSALKGCAAAAAALPLRYTALLASRSLAASDSLFSYAPAAASITTSTAIPAADEAEAAATVRLAEQEAKNKAVQARVDALYAAVAAASAGKKTQREEKAASPKGGRPSKKHTAESKTVFSLT